MTERPYTNLTFSGVPNMQFSFGGICLFRQPKLPEIFGFNCDENEDFSLARYISPTTFVKISLFYFCFWMD